MARGEDRATTASFSRVPRCATIGRHSATTLDDACRRQRILERYGGGDRRRPAALHGAAFAERGVYRPGEKVYLKGIVAHLALRVRISRRPPATRRAGRSRGSATASELDAHQARTAARRSTGSRGSARASRHVRHPARRAASAATTRRWRSKTQRRLARRGADGVRGGRVPRGRVRARAGCGYGGHAVRGRHGARARAARSYLFGMPMEGGATRVELAPGAGLTPWEMRACAALEEFYQVGRAWWRLPPEQRTIDVRTRNAKRLDHARTRRATATLASGSVGPRLAAAQREVSVTVTRREPADGDRRRETN